MAKKITVIDNNGTTTEITVTDDDTARHYEDLPFTAPHITVVTVTDDNER
ncbi:hypothetical protein [Streptomyces caeruleatus]|nr:hypothetical protein [Streptomyces caeruleatus]